MKLVTATKQYIIESIAEIRKVVWPTREETVHQTILVVIFSLAVALFLGGLDYIFSLLVEMFLLA